MKMAVGITRDPRPRTPLKLLLSALLCATLVLFAGSLLVASDPVRGTDAIIVIGGDHKPDRVRRAVELYQQGYASKVIISAGTIVLEGDEQVPEAEVMRRQAVTLGLPMHTISLEARSRSTFENAYYSRAICRQLGIHSVLLVTSVLHSSRAKRIFHDVFGDEIAVSVQPSVSTNCPLCWAFDPSQFYVILYEYWNWLQYWLYQNPLVTN